MKKALLLAIHACTLAGLSPQTAHAQGTMTYLSNLGQPSTGSFSVGSNSWIAAAFSTGTNAAAYSLDSVQLAITDASGNPSGFTVMICPNRFPPAGLAPGSSLGTLNGSLDPVASGIYTYTPAATLTLSPRTPYFIVVTAETAISTGAYEWSFAGINSFNPTGGWSSLGAALTSSDGSLPWTRSAGTYPQFAINATGVPEPSSLVLLALGGGFLFWHRRKV